jgi:hypothetical protein
MQIFQLCPSDWKLTEDVLHRLSIRRDRHRCEGAWRVDKEYGDTIPPLFDTFLQRWLHLLYVWMNERKSGFQGSFQTCTVGGNWPAVCGDCHYSKIQTNGVMVSWGRVGTISIPRGIRRQNLSLRTDLCESLAAGLSLLKGPVLLRAWLKPQSELRRLRISNLITASSVRSLRTTQGVGAAS